jgi:flavin-dependent dehydrogenase
MPKRQTKRGDERTSLTGSYNVIVCGASFAGLTVARQLAGSGARVLVLDRYEIGERQTSACGIPTAWLHIVKESIRTVMPRFSARRMMKDYVESMYAPVLVRE